MADQNVSRAAHGLTLALEPQCLPEEDTKVVGLDEATTVLSPPPQTATVPPEHPLVHPASLYSRMRASVHPEHKLRGAMHWLNARAKRERLAQAFPLSEEDLRRLAVRLEEDKPGITVLDAQVAQVEVLLVLPDRQLFQGPISAQVLLVREEDGRRTLGLLLDLPTAFGGAELEGGSEEWRCRAMLFEPEVVTRLRSVLDASPGVSENAVLRAAVEANVVAGNLEIARILSAVPELEGDGQLARGQLRFRRLSVLEGMTQLPPRARMLSVVVACWCPARRKSLSRP